MWLRLLELAGIDVNQLEADEGRNLLVWSIQIALSITLCSVVVFVCYRKKRRINKNVVAYGQCGKIEDLIDTASEREYGQSTVHTSDDENSYDMTFLYCPNGCQGACACPILDGSLIDSRGLSRQERARQRVHLLLGKMLIFPEYLRQMFEEDEKLVETVEQKLDGIFETKERITLSRNSSLLCSLASKELQEAPLRRIGVGLSINYDPLAGSSMMDSDTSQEHRHIRKRRFRKVLSSVKDGKSRERSGTI